MTTLNHCQVARVAATADRSPADAANAILRQSPYPLLRTLECFFRDGVLVIKGRLPSFYLKQVVQVALSGIDGVDRIDDRISVGVRGS